MHILHMPRSDFRFIRLRRMPLSLGRRLLVPFCGPGTLDNTRLYFYYGFDYIKRIFVLQYLNIHKKRPVFLFIPVVFSDMSPDLSVPRAVVVGFLCSAGLFFCPVSFFLLRLFSAEHSDSDAERT